MARRSSPEVNAGSMADIAFLLLIFFLVTTTIERDNGLLAKLPPYREDNTDVKIKEKNLFQVLINKDNRLLVEDEPMELTELTEAAVAFIDNGGGEGCPYCEGARDPESSDNPEKAVISFVNDRQASYKYYLAVQNELNRAYFILRDRMAQRMYNESWQSMLSRQDEWPEDESDSPEKEELDNKIKKVKDLYPIKISEAEPKPLAQ